MSCSFSPLEPTQDSTFFLSRNKEEGPRCRKPPQGAEGLAGGRNPSPPTCPDGRHSLGSPFGFHLQGFWPPTRTQSPRTRNAARSRARRGPMPVPPHPRAACRMPGSHGRGSFIIFRLFVEQALLTFPTPARAPALRLLCRGSGDSPERRQRGGAGSSAPRWRPPPSTGPAHSHPLPGTGSHSCQVADEQKGQRAKGPRARLELALTGSLPGGGLSTYCSR